MDAEAVCDVELSTWARRHVSVKETNAVSNTMATVYGAGTYIFKAILSNGPDFYGVNWIGNSQTCGCGKIDGMKATHGYT